MKEQPIETQRNAIDYSVGQRPIHETYEPPNPIPQFRPRPKLHQPTTRKQAYPSFITKPTQDPSPKVSADSSQAANSKKND